ncbi:MAG TPA: M20/M25/M40 family metallo-hydrolase [Verrucomicrobiae bacterium]|nr:M20/M25/M40 family metallo-hydrolase [Verrucomicrobiae bacterium]
MKRSHHLLVLLLLSCSFAALAESELNLAAIDQASSNAPGLFLNPAQRVQTVRSFLALAQVKGGSGREEMIRDTVKRLLVSAGAIEIRLKNADSNAPLNLVMQLPATGELTNAPGMLLNAHLDTIAQSTPENILFDPESGDFYHRFQTDANRNSSFGGDDRSGVAAIVEAIRVLQTNYWSRGVPHRKIVLLFTADEERGCVGARYISKHQPELFQKLDLSLSMDGPLDFRPNPPTNRVIAVVANAALTNAPYQRVMELLRGFSRRTQIAFEHTEYGLGRGDFAYFPESARAGLHLRSPVRGYHTKERVNVRDQINHVELLCYLILGLDGTLPP